MIIFDKEVDNLERIFGLDFLRALAIILVILAHSLHYMFPEFVKLFPGLLDYFGIYGVEIFFVLSGFLIGTIIIKDLNEEGKYDFKKIKHFWIRRWFRTLPNYYLVLVFFLVLDGFHIFKYMPFFLSYLVFLQNFFGNEPSFYGVTWSLAIEEWFYLLFPLTLFLVLKTNIKKYRALWITIILFLVVTFFFKGFIFIVGGLYRKGVVSRLDSIAIGVIAGIVNYYHKGFWDKNKKLFFILGMSSIIISILLLIFLNNEFLLKTFFYTYLSFSIALVFPLVCTMKRFKFNDINRLITHISIISYSAYLIHIIIILLTYDIQIKSHQLSPILGFLQILLLIFMLSTFQYRFFEKPMTRLRERFSKKQLIKSEIKNES